MKTKFFLFRVWMLAMGVLSCHVAEAAMSVIQTGKVLVGQSPIYSIAGAPANCALTWDSWFTPVGGTQSQVAADYPNGKIDGLGNATVSGGAWTEPLVGHWTVQATACSVSAITQFMVRDPVPPTLTLAVSPSPNNGSNYNVGTTLTIVASVASDSDGLVATTVISGGVSKSCAGTTCTTMLPLTTAGPITFTAQGMDVSSQLISGPNAQPTVTIQAVQPATISVSINPPSANVAVGQFQQFTATVQNSAHGVTWSLSSPLGTIDSTGKYAAPSYSATVQTVTVIATSIDNPGQSAQAVVSVQPNLCSSTAQCGTGFYCDPSNTCQSLPAMTAAVTQPADGASYTLGQSIPFTGTTTSSDSAFLEGKVGLVVTMDGSSVCQGHGYQCSSSVTPPAGSHTFQAAAYVQDNQGYYLVTQSAPVTISVTATQGPPPCTSTAQCGMGSYCDPQQVCQTLPMITAAVTQPAADSSFSSGQTISISGTTSGSNSAFIQGKVGLVITMDDLSICQGQGYQCAISTVPVDGPHTLQAVAYVQDIQGYYPVAQSAPVAFTMTPPQTGPIIHSCSSTAQCGSGYYCDAQAICQILPTMTASITSPVSGQLFQDGQTMTVQGAATSSDAAFLSGKVGLVITMDGASVCQGQGFQCATSVSPAVGTHSLQAIAYVADIQGYYAAAQSAPVSITMNPPPVTISLSPSNSSLRAGQAQQLTATVAGVSNTSVVWSMSPTLGTLSTAGLYRAPGGLLTPQSVTITATSVANPQKSAQAIIQLASYTPLPLGAPSMLSDMLGVTDWGGTYRLSTQGTQLEEESERIQAMGTGIIYVALSFNYQSSYLNSNFGGPIGSLTDLAKSAPFVHVFNQPFKTYLLAAFTFSNQSYLGSPNLPGEYKEINDLANYLLKTYAGTGKTFIIKNWEGDNALAQQEGCDLTGGCVTPSDYLNFTPHLNDMQNMIDWINTRQEAIVDARKTTGASGVQVLQAIEFVRMSRARNGQLCVLNNVVPFVDTDLVSYSSYETINVPTTLLQSQIVNDLGFVKAHPAMHARQLMIGEFGWQNTAVGYQDADIRTNIATQAFFNAGVVLSSYWALYDNGSGQCLVNSSGDTTPAGDTMSGLEGDQRELPDVAGLTAQANALTTSSKIQVGVTGAVASVHWTITGDGVNASVLHANASRSAWANAYSSTQILRVQTSQPQLDLGQLGLSPGAYYIYVYTVDSSGHASPPAGVNVVLGDTTVNTTVSTPEPARVFPNPWKATTADKKEVTFQGLTGHSTIKLFTVSGRSVQTLTTDSAAVSWDLRNRSGDDVASGIYIYSITHDQGQSSRGKLVLIR